MFCYAVVPLHIAPLYSSLFLSVLTQRVYRSEFVLPFLFITFYLPWQQFSHALLPCQYLELDSLAMSISKVSRQQYMLEAPQDQKDATLAS